MSANANLKDPPPYIIPVEGEKADEVKVYHVHTPFTPPPSSPEAAVAEVHATPVYGSSPAPKNKFVQYETELGRSAGTTTCTSCQQTVMTDVTYKIGPFVWIMVVVFIFCGLGCGCCIIPFFIKQFKDVYHSCPQCKRVLHVDKKRCC